MSCCGKPHGISADQNIHLVCVAVYVLSRQMLLMSCQFATVGQSDSLTISCVFIFAFVYKVDRRESILFTHQVQTTGIVSIVLYMYVHMYICVL